MNITKNLPPELLLPVGNMEMCKAAIHNGADAVYFGVPDFNARGRTQDFSFGEIEELINLCHLYGVKVHLALNVLIFEKELQALTELLLKLIPLGPDAFIVQDIGLVSLIRKISPDVPIHASTQMTVTNYDSIELLRDLQIERFVLGREVSMPEMELIRGQTQCQLEVFVHGALCVAYSGQCFTSEGLGGRSANRGQCAQSCRPEYDLIVDGEKIDLGEKRNLLSPKDLCGIDDIPSLIKLGINSFKIEGRLKSPQYVAQVAKAYRQACEKILSAQDLEILKRKMSLTYSRGFFSGWLHGVDHQNLVDGTYSSHRGEELGKVVGHTKGKILVESSLELKTGQGLLFAWFADGQKREVGGKIASCATEKGENIFLISLWEQDKDKRQGQKIPIAAKVYLNSDPLLEKELLRSYHQKEYLKKIPLSIKLSGGLGTPLTLQMATEGKIISVQSVELLEQAKNFPLTKKSLAEFFSHLGGSCFALDLDNPKSFVAHLNWDDQLFLHQKALKELRQRALKELTLLRMTPPKYQIQEIENNVVRLAQVNSKINSPINLHLLLRKKSQVDGLIHLLLKNPEIRQNLGHIILDYEFGKDYAPSLQALRENGLRVGLATTRILKPKEYHHLKLIQHLQPDVILIRNLGALHFFSTQKTMTAELLGDFSLNATNHLSCDYLFTKGLSTLCASYDLSASQLKELLQNFSPEKIEVNLHQYMPLFHMEHCVFAAFLSKGHSFRDCGKPCEKHQVELRDAYGNTHFLKADQECRNTMYNGKAQSAATMVKDLKELGVKNFRLELLDENAEILEQKILGHFHLLFRNKLANELIRSLDLIERYGVNAGTFAMEGQYQDRKK